EPVDGFVRRWRAPATRHRWIALRARIAAATGAKAGKPPMKNGKPMADTSPRRRLRRPPPEGAPALGRPCGGLEAPLRATAAAAFRIGLARCVFPTSDS